MKVRLLTGCLLICGFSSLAWADLNDGLVAYYPFNGNAQDESGTGLHGLMMGPKSTKDQNGEEGAALEFDGIDDYIYMGTSFPDLEQMTFAFWVYTEEEASGNVSRDSAIICEGDSAPANDTQIVINKKGEVYLTADKAGKRLRTSFTLDSNFDETWRHVVWVMTGEYSDIYVDGKLAERLLVGGSNVGNHEFYIGTVNRGFNGYWQGKLSSLRIYDRVLSEAEIVELYGTNDSPSNGSSGDPGDDGGESVDLNDGLVAYYPFNGNADDASGYGHHGVVHGAELTSNENGIENSAYNFDGINDYIDFGSALPDMDEMTVSLCLFIPGPDRIACVFSDTENLSLKMDLDHQIKIVAKKNGQRLEHGFDLYESLQSKSQFPITNRWIHMVWVMTRYHSTIYIDGIARRQYIEGGSNVGAHDLQVGCAYWGGSSQRPQNYCWQGQISSMRFYNRSLNESEITALYDTCGENGGSDDGPKESLYVDDDAQSDPAPYDLILSDPDEDGTEAHPYDSIQEAIDAAEKGGKIVVRTGTYYETIDFQGKSIHLTGFDPNVDVQREQPCPIIDADYQGTAVTFSSGEDSNTQLSGFTITRGLGQYAGGILCLGSHPRISNCLIVGNRAGSSFGGGAVYSHNSHASFDSCTMSGNYGGQAGAAFYSDESENTITNSILWDNLPTEVWYPMFEETPTPPVFTYCALPLEAYWIGNIMDDPGFVLAGYWAKASNPDVPTEVSDLNTIWIDGDYHLMMDSPCVDAGNPESIVDPYQLDLDGQPRVVNERVDMGSDEYVIEGHGLVALYNELSIPLVADTSGANPETTYIGHATVQLDAASQQIIVGHAFSVSEAGGLWTVVLSPDDIGPGTDIDVELTIKGRKVDVTKLSDISGTRVLAHVELDGVLAMEFVSINDPGVPDHEGFNGEMSKYETTNAQYCQYLNDALADGLIVAQYNRVYDVTDKRYVRPFFDTSDATPTSQIIYANGKFSVRRRDGISMINHPVVEVSWFGAEAFCDYYGYRLPTKWEWQAVADYDGSYTYGCGTTISQSKANYHDIDYANPLGMSDYPFTSHAGYYPAYGYGLCDMAGNVWEWTSSTYSGSYRTLCGGGWNENSTKNIVANRGSFSSFDMFYSIGFRVCR